MLVEFHSNFKLINLAVIDGRVTAETNDIPWGFIGKFFSVLI